MSHCKRREETLLGQLGCERCNDVALIQSDVAEQADCLIVVPRAQPWKGFVGLARSFQRRAGF